MIRRGCWLSLILLISASAKAADAPKLWAIVIGIDSCNDKKIPSSPGAARDAREIRNWLVNTAGWDRQQVLVMDGNSQAIFRGRAAQIDDLLPTKANLDNAFKEWLPYRARPGDMVLVYFAGQAIGGLNIPNSRDGLLPIDAKADRLDETGWNLADALNTIASKGENPILMWLDTSLSGRGKPVADLKQRRTNPDRFLGELTRWPGTAAWIAASGSPSVEAATVQERSPFVKAVIPALGSRDFPINLLGSLFTTGRDPKLVKQGFRAAGALGPSLALWPKLLADSVPPPSEFLLQRGHADVLTGLVFSADGSTMISSSDDSSIKVWRVSDRTLLRTLPGHMIGVTAMALSPDGSMLASGDGAGRVLLWSLTDYHVRRLPGRPPHLGGVSRIVFLGNGSTFASMDRDARGRVILWKTAGETLKPTTLIDSATSIAADGPTLAVATLPSKTEAIVRLFDSNGKPIGDRNGLKARILPESLAIRGDRVAAGDKSGLVLAWNISDSKIVQRFEAGEAITSLAIGESAIVAGSGETAWTLDMVPGNPPKPIKLDGTVARVVLSGDGQSAAAATDDGRVFAWKMPNTVVKVESRSGGPATTVLAFPPQGDRLVSGDQDGGVRFWEWPSGASHSRIQPGRGKIETLAATNDGQTLLQIDHDYLAKLWDLGGTRGLKTVAGKWISGTFSPDGATIALTAKTGEIVLVDPKTAVQKETQFDRPMDVAGRAILSEFGPIAISPNGKFIAAGSRVAPVAAMWSIEGGKPSKTVLDHADRISAISIASDSVYWLTGSLDGTAKIWSGQAEAPVWILKLEPGNQENADTAVTAARIAPGPISRAVTGHRDGRVILWKLDAKGNATPTELGVFEGPISSLEFLDNGQRLIAGSWDKTVRVWTAKAGHFTATNAPLRLVPQHTEKVNVVLGPAAGKYLASAGDDGSIRFWKSDGSALLGTVSTSLDDGTWVAFDPAGHFDSAPGGEAHVSFLQEGKVLSLDQSNVEDRIYGLGGMWLGGTIAEGKSPLLAGKPVGLAIDPPTAVADGDEVELKVHLGDAALTELRLYQNDIPVRSVEDFQQGNDPKIRTVKVRLGTGENRFVAMAARPAIGSIHGRSNAITMRGPVAEEVPKGVVHILSLGVSEYDINKLKFAHSDASDLADYLETNGRQIGRKAGITKVLQNKDVRNDVVVDVLKKISNACRPEDTVVIFLAGHTDVRRDDRFCLLLDKFPFAKGALDVGMRGPIHAKPNIAEKDLAGTILPYATIYRSLSRMDARNRLVVIDACQAGAIFDDPAIQRIQRKTDDGAHESRTSYLLAARRGEPAAEAAVLKHGLMTYLLLLGMGSEGLEPPPGGGFGLADVNGDKTITTEELRQYLDINLPILASRIAAGVPRSNPNPANPNPVIPVEPLKARGGTSAFPVSRLLKK